MCRGAYIPYLKINAPIFCCPLFSENYLNPQARVNKLVNKHVLNYHTSPSQLTSRIHRLRFLWSPKGFISPEPYMNFFLNLYIPPWLWNRFKFIVLRLLENIFVSQRIELLIFTHAQKQNYFPGFYHYPQAEENYLFPPKQRFLKIYFPQQKGGWGVGENYGVEKINKIKPTRVLVTNFDKFHHLCNLYIFGFSFVVL